MSYILLPGNDQYVEIDGLIDGTTRFLSDGVTLNPSPTYVNNGSGTLKVLDSNGAQVVIAPSGGKTSTLTYIAGSNGGYRALITSDFVSQPGRFYTVVIDLTTPGGGVAHWELPATVRPRVV